MVWSDEKKWNLDGPDGFAYYWHDLRKEPEMFSKRAQGGGSAMIWASFGWNGKIDLYYIESRLNALDYRDILDKHLVNVGQKIACKDWIYQHDNAQIHREKVNIP